MELTELPTTDEWTGYDWGSVIAEGRPDEWYSGPYIDTRAYEVLSGADKGHITPARIVAVPHLWADSSEGYASTDAVLMVELADGWATLTAWCDTTGWDCQSGGDWKWAATKDEAIRNGLDKEGRIRLGLALPGEAPEAVDD